MEPYNLTMAPRIYNNFDTGQFTFAALWTMQVQPESGAGATTTTTIIEGPCFPPEGSYPGVVPPTVIIPAEEDYFGNINENAGGWIQVSTPNRGHRKTGSSYTNMRFEVKHLGPYVWKEQNIATYNDGNSSGRQILEYLYYERPDNLEDDEIDPDLPFDINFDCFYWYQELGVYLSTDPMSQPTFIPLRTQTDLPSPPDTIEGTVIVPGVLIEPPEVEIVGPPKIVIKKVDDEGVPVIWDDPGAGGSTTPSITVDLRYPGLYYIDYTSCDGDGYCTTVTRQVLVSDEDPPEISVADNGDGTATVTSDEDLLDEDLGSLTGTITLNQTVCVIDDKGRVHCVYTGDPDLGQTPVPTPQLGPINLSGIAQDIPLPSESPANLTAEVLNPPVAELTNLTAETLLAPANGPINLKSLALDETFITKSSKYKGYAFDPRTSSLSGPFVSEAVTAVTTKDNSSEMYAVNQQDEIVKTTVTDLNNTEFALVADPFLDLSGPLANNGVIMSKSGQGFLYRNRYKTEPFGKSVIGSGVVTDPLYFQDGYLSIAETNWMHLGDEHNEKQIHRVDLRFHKNSTGHLFLYVQNDDGKVKGQYKGAIKEHMKVFTNLRGRGFQICMMVVGHKDHPWAMREMAVGHLYGKSF